MGDHIQLREGRRDSWLGQALGRETVKLRESSGQVYDHATRTSTRPLSEAGEKAGVFAGRGRTATVGRPVKDDVRSARRKRRADRGRFSGARPALPPFPRENFAHSIPFSSVDSL